MRTVIIEDEALAVKNLKAILKEVAPDLSVIATLDSVKSSVDYFKKNAMPDLVFMDIQLADGESFLIFNDVEITCPVIFTTAYDSYALKAFKVNSIDYLLKPIEPDDVKRALSKLKNLSNADLESYSTRINTIINQKKEYTKTLLISYRDKLIPLSVNQIAFFYTKNERVIATTFEHQEWQVDSTLETLISKLSPTDFFRASRQYIIAHKAIKEVVIWFDNRLTVTLTEPPPERIIISKARVASFKSWLIKN